MGEEIAGLVMLAFGLALVAVLSVVATRAAAEGGLARNGLMGIRTRHTRASDEAWRVGHAAALPTVRLIPHVTVATYAAGVAAFVVAGGGAAVAVGLTGMAVQVAVLMVGVSRANRAARGTEDGGLRAEG